MKRLAALLALLLASGVALGACPAGSTCTAFDAYLNGLSAANPIGGTELFPCYQSTTTKKCTPAQMSTYVLNGSTVPSSTTLAGLSIAETWTALQTITNSDLALLGSSTGKTTLTSANAGASNFTITIPAITDTLVTLSATQTLTNKSLSIGQLTGLGIGIGTFLATPSSANLAAAITDETGTGLAVFNNSAVLVTPAIAGSSTGTTTIASANAGASNFTATLPAATDTVVELAATQTLTNKTLTSPTVGTGMILSWLSGIGQCLVETSGVVSSTACGGAGTTFQTNTTGLSSSSTVNFENGPGITVSNPSAGNVQFTAAYSYRTVSGTTDTVLSTDCASGVRYTSASAIAVTLPQATSSFATCSVDIIAAGAGTVTVTPTTSTINGGSTITIAGGNQLNANITADTGNYDATGTYSVPGGGSGTVASSTSGQIPVYTGSTTVTGGANATLTAGALTLGVSGTLGSIKMGNASSGTLTLQPVTGALGAVTVSIPDATDTLVNLAGTQSLSNKTFVAPALGTPVSGVGTNLTGVPISTGVSGLATGIAAYLAAGTTFTITPTGCTPSAHAGGPFGGTITLASGPCTSIVVTMNGATGFTAQHGYDCSVGDQTTQLAGTYIPKWGQTAQSTTTATIPIPAAAGATDVISFNCTPN